MNLKFGKFIGGGLQFATLSFDLEKGKRGVYVSIAPSLNTKSGGVD